MSETDERKEDEEAPSREPAASEEGSEDGVELDEVDVRDLLRSALSPPEHKPKEEAQILKGVQRRIRLRSKGKFYSDGWSTSRSPRSTYLVTSIFMLVLIAFVFLVLIPWSNTALP